MLVALTHLLLLLVSKPIDQIKNVVKLGIPVELDLLNGIVVARHDSLDPVGFRSINVAVQSEAVTDLVVRSHWADTPEPIQRKHFVVVIVLKNVENCVYRLSIVVGLSVRVEIVQRLRVIGILV